MARNRWLISAVVASAVTLTAPVVTSPSAYSDPTSPGQTHVSGTASGRPPHSEKAGRPIPEWRPVRPPQSVTLVAPSIGYTPAYNAFSAKLTPAKTGRRVTLEKRVGKRWTTLARGKEVADGSVSWRVRLRGSGTARLRAVAARTRKLAASHSTIATVRLVPVPPPAEARTLQVASVMTPGTATMLDLGSSLDVVSTLTVEGTLPAGVALSLAGGTVTLAIDAGAAPGVHVLHARGTGCVRNACRTPYTLEVDVAVSELESVDTGTETFTDPSPDRIAETTQIGAGAEALADEVEVVLGSDVDPGSVYDAQSLAAEVGAVVTGGLDALGIFQLRWNEPVDVASMVTRLEEYDDVHAAPAAVFDGVDQSVALGAADRGPVPNDWSDDGAAVKWPFDQIHAQRAWSTTTGSDVAVGVVEGDSVYRDHEDLNVRDTFGTYNLDSMHATHVAGLACAVGGNRKGLVGVGWGCPIDSSTFGFTGWNQTTMTAILEAATALAVNGDPVVNMSIGYNHPSGCETQAESDATNRLVQSLATPFRRLFNGGVGRDVVWVMAAGNNCAVGPQSPWGVSWALPNVVTVAASNYGRTLASFSDFGPGVEVAAPGGMGPGTGAMWSTVWSTCAWLGVFSRTCSSYEQAIDGGLAVGTSMATPMVAGVAALARSARSDADAAEVGSCIVSTAGASTGSVTALGTDGVRKPKITFSAAEYGALGIVDAAAAVACVRDGTTGADTLITGQGDRTSAGNGTDRGDLFAALAAAHADDPGYRVQMTDELPDRLDGYGQIWYLDTVALDEGETARLEEYIRSGGSVYLTGERTCCTSSDTVVEILYDLTPDFVSYYGSDDYLNDWLPVVRDVAGITSTPNRIDEVLFDAPGLLDGVAPEHAVLDDDDPDEVVWAVYDRPDVTGGGKIVAMMDINWLAVQYRGANWAQIVENINAFLAR